MTFPIIALIALVAGLAAAGVVWFVLDRRSISTGVVARSAGGARFAIAGAAFLVAAGLAGGVLYALTGGSSGSNPADRVLGAIARHHPEAKPEIDAIRAETSPARAQQRSAELAQRYLPRHLPTTSDEAVLRFTSELTKVFESLAEKDPETCKALTGVGGGRVSANFEPQNMTRSLDAMAQVIDDSVDAPQPPPQQQRAQQLLSGVITRLYAQPDATLAPPQMLAQPATVPAPLLCNTMIAFYREILKLPAADASAVLRTLMRGPTR